MIYNRKNKKGFTLMELLVTVILVAILASYGVYYYTDIINEGKLNAAKGKLAALGGATARFLTENAMGLECSYGLDTGLNIEELMEDNSRHCIGESVDQKWYMFDVFACGYAEKTLGIEENFIFYFGCPSELSCGDFNQMTVLMKPKEGAPEEFPKCAYFDTGVDRVIEVR